MVGSDEIRNRVLDESRKPLDLVGVQPSLGARRLHLPGPIKSGGCSGCCANCAKRRENTQHDFGNVGEIPRFNSELRK